MSSLQNLSRKKYTTYTSLTRCSHHLYERRVLSHTWWQHIRGTVARDEADPISISKRTDRSCHVPRISAQQEKPQGKTMKRTMWTLLEMRCGQAPLSDGIAGSASSSTPICLKGRSAMFFHQPFLKPTQSNTQEITVPLSTPPCRHIAGTLPASQLHLVASVAPDWTGVFTFCHVISKYPFDPIPMVGSSHLVYHVFADGCEQTCTCGRVSWRKFLPLDSSCPHNDMWPPKGPAGRLYTTACSKMQIQQPACTTTSFMSLNLRCSGSSIVVILGPACWSSQRAAKSPMLPPSCILCENLAEATEHLRRRAHGRRSKRDAFLDRVEDDRAELAQNSYQVQSLVEAPKTRSFCTSNALHRG